MPIYAEAAGQFSARLLLSVTALQQRRDQAVRVLGRLEQLVFVTAKKSSRALSSISITHRLKMRATSSVSTMEPSTATSG
jgi:hypothetical protein